MELTDYMRFIAALAFVVALIVGFAWLAKRFGLAGAVGAAPRTATRRLAVVEVLPVDAKRRLLLVRRDNTEHLVLLGTERDLLIEAEITPSSPAEPSVALDPPSGENHP